MDEICRGLQKPADMPPIGKSQRRILITVICGIYLVLAGIFSTTTLDIDELTFVREPYEILGGDYTLGYLRKHEYVRALKTFAKSYYFFWYYRPLNAPVVREDHRSMFRIEEREFGYIKPPSVQAGDPAAIENYQARLVVPEPDRFYTHGAGKPLLPALLSIPQLALLKCFGITTNQILLAQYRNRYDPLFIVFRLVQIIGGLASVLLVFKILERTIEPEKAYLGALVFAIFPSTIKYFPNLHHDSILVPFVLLAVYLQMMRRYVAAGAAYGLALASKNLAIIVLPALVADFTIAGFRLGNEVGWTTALAFLRTRLAAVAVMGVVAFGTLLPFANPISYGEEILTPLISRPADPRGENVTQWTLNGILDNQSNVSPQVTFAQKYLYFNDLGFMFFVLALCLAIQKQPTSITKLSIIIMVLYLPISSVFGLLLQWRTLLLVPFFAMAAAELLQGRQLRWLAGATAVLALLYISDPSKTDLIHTNQYIADQRSRGEPSGSATSSPGPVTLCGSSNSLEVKGASNTSVCNTGTTFAASEREPGNWSCIGGNSDTTNGCAALLSRTGTLEKPGPSAALFTAPFYSCVRNFYVATNGSDSNPGTEAQPWRTIQHADLAAGGRVAGDCVNVLPGVYAERAYSTRGGNAPTPTGYVVYRCTQLNACKITDSRNAFVIRASGGGPNFVVLDGFELSASTYATYGVAVGIGNAGETNAIGNHHIWIINNIIHGYGQSGIDGGGGEYYYLLHNLSYENSRITCDAQGSGIGIVTARAFPSYVPIGMDLTYAPFRNIVAWNISHDNQLTRCGSAVNPYDTDGNGIIIDTFNNQGTTGVLYPYRTLVAFNIVYNNGGGGIHVFRSSFVTVANNTAYSNGLDPYNGGTAQAQIDISGGHNNLVINNIAYPVPAISRSDPRCHGVDYSVAPWNLPNPCPLQNIAAFLGGSSAGEIDANNVWSNNVSFGGTPPYVNQRGNAIWSPDAVNCTITGKNPNKCNVNPLLVNPIGGNFALQAGSPAIGYGLFKPYLGRPSVDAGACDYGLSACP
jgi:parallel beta-helix repeat protein